MKKEETPFSSPSSCGNWRAHGKQMAALITDITSRWAAWGQRSKWQECIEVLHGRVRDLRELLPGMAAWMFFLGGASKTVVEGSNERKDHSVRQGVATFRHMVELQGGDNRHHRDPTRLPTADYALRCPVKSWYVSDRMRTSRHGLRDSWRASANARGRFRRSAVGIVVHKKIGDKFRSATRSAQFNALRCSKPREPILAGRKL